MALNRAMRSEELVINGQDFSTNDGTCERDYVHVEDVAQANVQACSADISGFAAMNIGNGIGYSNLQIADAVNHYTKYPLSYSFGDARPGDPGKLISNNSRAKMLLDWQPKHSELKNIIQTAEQWHEKTENSQ
jgi:UDP-glucose 4-epimerase